MPDTDIRNYLYQLPINVYGVLFAMLCTDYAVSGARWWEQKDKDGRTLESTKILTHGLMIIAMVQPEAFWVMENPVGRLNEWVGKPVMYFNPCDYGDPYTKKTALWGKFNIPEKNPVEPIKVCKQGSWILRLGGNSERTKRLRSVTPEGFARAFYKANM